MFSWLDLEIKSLILSQASVREFSAEVRAKPQTKVPGSEFETAKDVRTSFYESWVVPAGVPSALADIGGRVEANY